MFFIFCLCGFVFTNCQTWKKILHILWSSHHGNKCLIRLDRVSICFSISHYIKYFNIGTILSKGKNIHLHSHLCCWLISHQVTSDQTNTLISSGCFPEEPLVPLSSVPPGTRLIVTPPSNDMTRQTLSSEQDDVCNDTSLCCLVRCQCDTNNKLLLLLTELGPTFSRTKKLKP